MSPSFLTSSVSKRSLRSLSRARGMISRSAKSRAVSRTRRCSSVSSKSIMRRGRLSSGRVLADRREPLADADAERRQAVARAAAAELPGERADQPRAGAAEGVAESDRAAVHVELVVGY